MSKYLSLNDFRNVLQGKCYWLPFYQSTPTQPPLPEAQDWRHNLCVWHQTHTGISQCHHRFWI